MLLKILDKTCLNLKQTWSTIEGGVGVVFAERVCFPLIGISL